MALGRRPPVSLSWSSLPTDNDDRRTMVAQSAPSPLAAPAGHCRPDGRQTIARRSAARNAGPMATRVLVGAAGLFPPLTGLGLGAECLAVQLAAPHEPGRRGGKNGKAEQRDDDGDACFHAFMTYASRQHRPATHIRQRPALVRVRSPRTPTQAKPMIAP